MTDRTDPTLQGEHAAWPDLAIALYERLTGRGAAINYEFHDFEIEVPRSTESKRASSHLENERTHPDHHRGSELRCPSV